MRNPTFIKRKREKKHIENIVCIAGKPHPIIDGTNNAHGSSLLMIAIDRFSTYKKCWESNENHTHTQMETITKLRYGMGMVQHFWDKSERLPSSAFLIATSFYKQYATEKRKIFIRSEAKPLFPTTKDGTRLNSKQFRVLCLCHVYSVQLLSTVAATVVRVQYLWNQSESKNYKRITAVSWQW